MDISTPVLLQAITDQARLIAGARYAALAVFGQRGIITQFFTSGLSAEEVAAIGELPKGLGLLGVLQKEGQPLRLGDMATHPASVGFPPNHPPMKSFLGVPIPYDQGSLGSFCLTEKQGAQEFSQEDEERLVLFASLAAMAIENDARAREARERTREIETTAELARIVTSNLDLEEVYDRFAQEVRKVVPFDRMGIILIDESQDTFLVAYLSGESSVFRRGESYPLTGSTTAWVARNRCPHVMPDFTTSGRFATDRAWAAEGFRSALRVPLVAEDRIFGVVSLVSRQPGAYDLEEARFLERLASHIVPAIENSQLFRRVRQLALAAANIGDGVCVTDPEGRIEFVNPALERMLGYEPGELLGRPVSALYPGGPSGPMLQEIMEGLLAGGWSGEADLRTESGELIPTQETATPIRDEDGRLVGYVCINADITERKRAEQALRESEERFRRLAEAIPDLMFVIGRDGVVQDYVPALRTEPSRPPPEFIGKPVGEAVAEEIAQPALENIARALETGEEQSFAFRIAVPLGSDNILSYESRIVALGPDKVLALARDVTSQKEAEEALRDSEERFRSIFELAPIGVAIITAEGNIAQANRSFQEMLGYTEDEFRRMTFAEFTHPDDVKESLSLFQEMIEGKRDYAYMEKRYYRKDGRPVRAHLAASAIREKEGKLQYGVALIEDITERKQAEEEIRRLKEFNERIIATTANGLLVLTSNLEIVSANPNSLKILGLSQEDVDGKRLPAIPHLQALAGVASDLLRFGKAPLRREVIVRPPNRERCWLRVTASHLSGDEEGVLLSLADVTEWIQTQQKVREASRLISLGELVAGVAHELNNPLTGVLGFAQLLEAQDLDASVKEDVQQILVQTKRAVSVVQNLLSFARKYEPERVHLDVGTVVDRVLALKAYDLRVSNIEVETDFGPGPLFAMADEHRLEEVFLNMVTNAEQAMTEAHGRGRLLVCGTKQVLRRAKGSTDVIRISFIDNGPGIAPEDQKRLFNPFFTTKGPGEGTGLGLSICKRLVQEQGGRTWVESEVGKGATFHVELLVDEPE